MEQSEYKKIIDVLKRKGHKITPQRLEIIRVILTERYKHPSLDEILNKVRQRVETVSFSTLYSTIMMLEELNMLKTFEHGGRMRVEVDTSPHINIIDTETGKVIDLYDEKLIKEIINKIRLKIGKDVNKLMVNVIVY